MVNFAVSDMITRIRNGIRVKKIKVSILSTNLTLSIAKILQAEGFIERIQTVPNTSPATFDIYLKYKQKYLSHGPNSLLKNSGPPPARGQEGQLNSLVGNSSVLTNLKCVSRPGVRIYANSTKIPQVLGGLGITILSTSKGVLTDYQARKLGVGGEVLCTLW
jgi:small subunit ribosomal protein S8